MDEENCDIKKNKLNNFQKINFITEIELSCGGKTCQMNHLSSIVKNYFCHKIQIENFFSLSTKF